MPDRSVELNSRDHLEGGRANERSAGALRDQHAGWSITALFYAAVHYVRGYLFHRHRVRVSSHEEMKQLWPRYPELRSVRVSYEMLKDKSQQHRYYLVDFEPGDVDGLTPEIERIRKFVEPRVLPKAKVLLDGETLNVRSEGDVRDSMLAVLVAARVASGTDGDPGTVQVDSGPPVCTRATMRACTAEGLSAAKDQLTRFGYLVEAGR